MLHKAGQSSHNQSVCKIESWTEFIEFGIFHKLGQSSQNPSVCYMLEGVPQNRGENATNLDIVNGIQQLKTHSGQISQKTFLKN